MYLFIKESTPEEAVITGFGLEIGLRDFYLSMKSQMKTTQAKDLFIQLADIEVLHQKQLLNLYMTLTGQTLDLEEFKNKVVKPAMEGGLTTAEYLSRYNIDSEDEVDILSLAIAIEVQALDLYLRAADSSQEETTRNILLQIADEERHHLEKLGKQIDQQLETA